MFGRGYTYNFENVSVSAIQDLFEANAATNKPFFLVGFGFFQRSDVGDAEEEILRITIKRITASFVTGTGGTQGITAVKMLPGDATSSMTVDINNTGLATGTAEIAYPRYPNIRVGEDIFLPPDCRPLFVNANPLIIRLETAPTDAITMSGYIIVDELG